MWNFGWGMVVRGDLGTITSSQPWEWIFPHPRKSRNWILGQEFLGFSIQYYNFAIQLTEGFGAIKNRFYSAFFSAESWDILIKKITFLEFFFLPYTTCNQTSSNPNKIQFYPSDISDSLGRTKLNEIVL